MVCNSTGSWGSRDLCETSRTFPISKLSYSKNFELQFWQSHWPMSQPTFRVSPNHRSIGTKRTPWLCRAPECRNASCAKRRRWYGVCLEPHFQPFINGWKWWFPTIFYIKIWFIIQLWLFGVPCGCCFFVSAGFNWAVTSWAWVWDERLASYIRIILKSRAIRIPKKTIGIRYHT